MLEAAADTCSDIDAVHHELMLDGRHRAGGDELPEGRPQRPCVGYAEHVYLFHPDVDHALRSSVVVGVEFLLREAAVGNPATGLTSFGRGIICEATHTTPPDRK